MVTRRTLSVQSKAKEEDQRQNLFHTRCLVQNRVCSLIIDGGSCANVASEELVEKLSLAVYKRPKPYFLQWLNKVEELKVSKQVKVLVSVGRYGDEITCDVLPLEASHILLGRPWQYDKRVAHDGFTNRHSFVHKEKQNTLVPLSPQEVHQDQMHLKRRRDAAKATRRALLLDHSVQVRKHIEECTKTCARQKSKGRKVWEPDKLDLRTNPFKGGGDGVAVDRYPFKGGGDGAAMDRDSEEELRDIEEKSSESKLELEEHELDLSKGGLDELNLSKEVQDELTNVWSGSVVRSRLKAQGEKLHHLLIPWETKQP